MTATRLLAQWVAGVGDEWPRAAITTAERAFTDTVACILAGVQEEAARRVREGMRGWSGRGATVIGTGTRLPAPFAALGNGTAAHALDYDDVLEVAASHVSAVLVPALLALGEERRSSGAALLDAYIVGVEVQARLAEAVNMVHYARGWHTTLTLGAPSAAAACARLLRLDAERTSAAISLSASLSGGSKRQFGTMAKPVHAGFAAQHGITAACLAEAGITAASEIFEGTWGFQDLFAGKEAPGFSDALARLGNPLAITEHGIWLKAYPCCASAHHVIDAVLALRQEYGFTAADVEAVDAIVSEVALRNLMYRTATSPAEARFSMNHCLAAAIEDGAVTLATFSPEAIERPELRSLGQLVTSRSDASMPATGAARDRSDRGEVYIRLRGGRVLHRVVRHPRGHPGAPLGGEALAAKFTDCARGVLGELTAERALRLLLELHSLRRTTDLIASLMPAENTQSPRTPGAAP